MSGTQRETNITNVQPGRKAQDSGHPLNSSGGQRASDRMLGPIGWIGAAFGLITLLGLLALMLLDVTHYLAPAFLAFGAALSAGFIGGDASVRGNLPLPSGLSWFDKPLRIAATGGIAVFVIVFLLASVFLEEAGSLPTKPEFASSVQQGDTFGNVVPNLARMHSLTPKLNPNCGALLTADLRVGTVRTGSLEALVENLGSRTVDPAKTRSVQARVLRDAGILEVTCDD